MAPITLNVFVASMPTGFFLDSQILTKSTGRYWNNIKYNNHNRTLQPKKETVFTNKLPPKSLPTLQDRMSDTARMAVPGKP